MKHFTLLICTLLLCGCTMEEPFNIQTLVEETKINAPLSDDYYWFGGKQEPLQNIPEYSFVITEESKIDNLNAVITRSGISTQGIEYKRFSIPKKAFRMNNESRIVWSKIHTKILAENETDILYSAPYFRTAEGYEVGVTNYFMIKLKAASDLDELERFATANKAIILYGNEKDLWYTLTCTSASEINALELANKAYESGEFAATDVEFVDDIHFSSAPSYNDTKYSTQWNLTGEYGINLDATHSITAGSDNITIAVIDNGFILNHPDMPIDAALSWDANSQTSPARQYNYNGDAVNNHGIGVAGIVGAVPGNSKGIVGIAPGVKLMAISARIEMHDSTDLTALNALKDAIYYAEEHNADVVNNSWTTRIKHQLLDDAISSALSEGRDGNGCVLVFASGNDSTNVSQMPYRDNVNVICVGGSTIDGYRYPGSNYSEHLDIVAPGSYIPTLGENPVYRNPDGTSYAAPHVSAIAGLMLSANPALSSTQITEILARTATKLPEYTFSIAKSHGTWNNEVGYGLVNCYDAVMQAYYYNEDNYTSLIEFDHTGQELELSLTVKDDIAVIWDWDSKDITYISASATSPVDTTITHTYSTSDTRHIIIAETVAPGETAPSSSSALSEFDLTIDNAAGNFDIKPMNSALKYLRIIGGPNIPSQTLTISNMQALEQLHIVNMKNTRIVISNCTNLKSFGTSRHIWTHSASGGLPIQSIGNSTADPDVVIGDGSLPKKWPDIPEAVVSPSLLSISNCPALIVLSLENVGFTNFSFSGLNNLLYVYLSSQASRIVGAGTNSLLSSTFGYYLNSAISTLPIRNPTMAAKIVIRAVNSSNTGFEPVNIASTYKTSIQEYCSSNYWTLVWDSGIN